MRRIGREHVEFDVAYQFHSRARIQRAGGEEITVRRRSRGRVSRSNVCHERSRRRAFRRVATFRRDHTSNAVRAIRERTDPNAIGDVARRLAFHLDIASRDGVHRS